MQSATTELTPWGGDNKSHSDLLTVNEACKKLRISRWSFYRLIKERQITTIRIGRRRLVPVIEIQTFIEHRSEEDS